MKVRREGFPDGAADAAVADRLSLQAGGHVNRVEASRCPAASGWATLRI
jgi:hypothetical protein